LEGGLVRPDERAERERLLLESSQRGVERFAFDLDQGPIESLAALREDVRHFRSYLSGVALDRDGPRVIGCVDDLEARLIALDAELRELMHTHLRP
jgi:hypothetical protein